MRKINILFCILNLAKGGTEKQLVALIEGLDRKLFEPHLCCIRNSMVEHTFGDEAREMLRSLSCKSITFDFHSFKKPATYWQVTQLANFIRKQRINIVVCYFSDPTIFAYLASRLVPKRPIFICSFRDMGLFRERQNKRLMRYIYRHADWFLANSHSVKNYFIQNDGIPPERFKVISNGIDIARFTSSNQGHSFRKTVGIVANLNRNVKRVDIFIRAAAIVCNDMPEIRFIVIGDGVLKKALMELALSLKIGNSIRFAGRVDNVERLLSQLTVGVNVSESEGLSNAILEFMAAGVAVIASETSGNKEIIDDGVNGFLFPVNDYFALAQRIIQLLNDDSLCQKMRINSLDSIKSCFDMKTMISNYSKFFKSIA